MKKIDMHTHTIHSDGVLSVFELLTLAKKKGLSGISITDHNSVEGLNEAVELSKKIGIEIISGIELDVNVNGKKIHLLGYFLNHKSPMLLEKLRRFNLKKIKLFMKYCLKLQKKGIELEINNVLSNGIDKNVLLHLSEEDASLLLEELEMIRNYAFDFNEAVELIRQANGVPVLAHLNRISRKNSEIEKIILEGKRYGLLGIEGIYTEYSLLEVKEYLKLAKKHDLIVTGGSDFHGKNRPDFHLGKFGISMERIHKIKEKFLYN